MQRFDAVVIGGGHAGVEASLALARLNKKTLMLCLDFGTVSLMPCNPAIGGIAKGHPNADEIAGAVKFVKGLA